MADSAVSLSAPTGNADTRTATNGDHRQVVVLGNDGDLVGGLTGYGAYRVTIEPTNLFADPFDVTTGLDTTHRWTTGGTVVPTAVTGAVQVQPGAAASASSSLVSKPTFPLPGVAFLALGSIARFENIGAGLGTVGFLNSHRFWGFGSIPTTWTPTYTASATSGPILSGVGFEIDTDGHCYCVVYDNGVRTRMLVSGGAGSDRVNNVRTIFDGNSHQFLIVVRADAIFWYVDSTTNPIASYNFSAAGFSAPDTATLPIRFHTINSGTAPSGTMVHRQGAVGVGDTGRNGAAVSDGLFPWRKAGVTDAAAFLGPPAALTAPGSLGPALNVNPNALQKRTYFVTRRPANGAAPAAAASPAAVANQPKILMTVWHANTATTTKRIRMIRISAVIGTAVNYIYEVYRTTTVATGGTALTLPQPPDSSEPATSLSAMFQSTVAIGTALVGEPLQVRSILSTTNGHADLYLYDWQENGETKPLTIRAGVQEGFCITSRTTTATAPDPIIQVAYTEE